jgi:hypothetical protein
LLLNTLLHLAGAQVVSRQQLKLSKVPQNEDLTNLLAIVFSEKYPIVSFAFAHPSDHQGLDCEFLVLSDEWQVL